MTQDEMRAELRAYVSKTHKTQEAAATHWGRSPAWVSMVLSGKKSPTARMLTDAGLERVTPPIYYRKMKKEKAA